MFKGKISDYFEGVAAKYLSAVDAEPERSNGHEIGGLPRAGFREYLGTPDKTEEFAFSAKQVYISDEAERPLIADSHVTWYDARRNKPHRSPEYRLYYYDSVVTEEIAKGDFLLIAKLRQSVSFPHDEAREKRSAQQSKGTLLMVFTPAGSSVEHQLRGMFGLTHVGETFSAGKLDVVDLVLPLRMMLEELGIDAAAGHASEGRLLEGLLERFGGDNFPPTREFSTFARESLTNKVSAIDAPDTALMAWMEHEESLFRVYERHIVQRRLRAGFGQDGQDVDAFVDFSLSVQNRRKSRVGLAFEGHLAWLFQQNGLRFERGRGKGKATEGKATPDFLFPSFTAYHDPQFPVAKLMMLGAKTTCKDRWRQVLSEARRIPSKHLVTLEPAISPSQLDEMHSHRLQLVVPLAVQATYPALQRATLMDLRGFIRAVQEKQTLTR
jgi:hypothetical protein